jgi:hypothetical protein
MTHWRLPRRSNLRATRVRSFIRPFIRELSISGWVKGKLEQTSSATSHHHHHPPRIISITTTTTTSSSASTTTHSTHHPFLLCSPKSFSFEEFFSNRGLCMGVVVFALMRSFGLPLAAF